MSLESDGGMILTGGNQRTRRKTCPSATLSTTDPTWIDPGVNPGLRGERPAANDLSHGTASFPLILQADSAVASENSGSHGDGCEDDCALGVALCSLIGSDRHF
jgi:hypothetical protein